MRKVLLLIVCILFSSCCYAKDSIGVVSNKRGLILQALDYGALGYICPKWALSDSDCRSGQLVYFAFNFDFVDGQRFKLPKGYYFYGDGVYKYTTRQEIQKTVRKINLAKK